MGRRRADPHSVNPQETTMNRCKLIRMTTALAATALLGQAPLCAQTWQTVDDLQYTPGKSSFAFGSGADGLGNLYVAGYAYAPTGPQAAVTRWIVRRSSDGGVSWQTVDVYQYNGYPTPAVGVVCTPAGVFVAGYGGQHWLVRQATP
jgi:hypothetical protein